MPKFIPDSVGEPGLRNEVRCVSLEHKLGIHGSPTALMSYGEDRGAVAYLVGEVNRGLEYMFIMMNAARHAVVVSVDRRPVSTMVQPSPSATAHTLIAGKAENRGIRSQSKPGETSTADPSPISGLSLRG